MLTQAQLVIELQHRGCHVTARQLRDWRTKGLLPPLTGRGRGQGLGVAHYWQDGERVLTQAITVCDLLDRKERTKWAFLGLWFAGYEVDIGKVQKAWLSSLARTKSEWLKDASSKEECEDALGDLSSRLAKKLLGEAWVRDAGLDWKMLEPLLYEALNACFNPHANIEIAVDQPVADTARAIMSRNNKTSGPAELMSGADLEKGLEFIHSNLSIGAMRRLISAATPEDLSLAHQRWRSALEVIRLFSAIANGGEIPENLGQMGRQLAVQFGGLCLFGLLVLERNGKGPLADFCLNEARQDIQNGIISDTAVADARL